LRLPASNRAAESSIDGVDEQARVPVRRGSMPVASAPFAPAAIADRR
jgi:hypothetical protein